MLDGLSPLQILPTVFYSFPTTLVIAVVQSLKSYLTLVDPMDYSMHARLPCPSLSPKVCSGSCPLSRWCYLTISSSATSFFFCLQSFPASGSFPMSRLFASGGRSIGASASASVLPVNIQGWFTLGFTDLISLQSKGLSRVFSSTTVRRDLCHCLQFADEEIELPGWWFKQPVSDKARGQSSWCKHSTFPPLLLRDGSANIQQGAVIEHTSLVGRGLWTEKNCRT